MPIPSGSTPQFVMSFAMVRGPSISVGGFYLWTEHLPNLCQASLMAFGTAPNRRGNTIRVGFVSGYTLSESCRGVSEPTSPFEIEGISAYPFR
jgi:hypothetical protein